MIVSGMTVSRVIMILPITDLSGIAAVSNVLVMSHVPATG